MTKNWKIGVEIELIAPRGLSRLSLAEALMNRCHGSVQTFFHPQAEHGASPNMPSFQNLTQGYRILDKSGDLVASLVDDLTLQYDCNKQEQSKPGWYRILSDDARLLSLIEQQCNPDEDLNSLLLPLADLFGTKPEIQQGMIRIADKKGSPVAMLAPLPGERERVCEIVTPPITENLKARLNALLQPALDLGFVSAAEAATHYHFDAEALCSAGVVSRLIIFFSTHEKALREELGTNNLCRRLNPMQPSLIALAKDQNFLQSAWPEAQQLLLETKPSKYQDVNFLNIARGDKQKHTLEIRMAGPCTEIYVLVERAKFLERILEWSLGSHPLPTSLSQFGVK